MQQQQQQQQTCSPSPSADAFRVPHAAAGASCSIFNAIKPTTSAQSPPPLPLPRPLLSCLHTKGKQSFFSALLSRKLCRERDWGLQPLHLTRRHRKPSQLNSVFVPHAPHEEVLAREALWENEAVLFWLEVWKGTEEYLWESWSRAGWTCRTPCSPSPCSWLPEALMVNSELLQNEGAGGCETSLRLLQPLSIPPSLCCHRSWQLSVFVHSLPPSLPLLFSLYPCCMHSAPVSGGTATSKELTTLPFIYHPPTPEFVPVPASCCSGNCLGQ